MNGFHLRSLPAGLLLIVLSGLIYPATAQSTNFGITGGMNISSHLNAFRYVNGDIRLNLDPKITTGYYGGMILRQNISKAFRLQMEPSLTLLGAKYEEPFMLRGSELQTDSRTKLLYIQLPLVLQLSTVPPQRVVYGRDTPKTTYHLTGGVFAGYLLDARFKGQNTGAPIGISFEGEFSNDITSQYAEYDGGVVFGMGVEHGLRRKIGLEARAQYSVWDSGNAEELAFYPHNMAVTVALYFIL
ncbi:porin family protein [Fodinibius sediminis]|uniref:Outer membrane protein beta-barrel domain-containing protein n=1 Tax=Fodinibius sediminis TaxID=1214077 RepID=A0A521B3T0_9BACT|nr:porin family protein [Fodinibius sediminis]SMO41380.1 Outer membrane protein beta-barrel domain-containing protein [Fodinibius sediminis]